MKTVRPPGYHHNGFVATHVLALCVSRITYDHLYIYIYIYIYIYYKAGEIPSRDTSEGSQGSHLVSRGLLLKWNLIVAVFIQIST